MKYYAVQLYKVIADGDCIEKGLLQEFSNMPAIFETTDAAVITARIVVRTLENNTSATWGFRIVEGKTI